MPAQTARKGNDGSNLAVGLLLFPYLDAPLVPLGDGAVQEAEPFAQSAEFGM